ncbi:hypothetical protein [Burkholderia sp. Ax-1724]|uniref:hypothetical protein n=1 Tax=Burkholderia sp. Ax-1724 TaxID=2608336 RepID=UPI0014208B8B|nr:hypothetical protein [Burkholderia sp. Ax-1724]NIF54412.1 hypothetical protein [Burkholderia sp. Ax-1724]
MATVTARKSTKKTFHFPKSTDAAKEQPEAAAPAKTVRASKTKAEKSKASNAAAPTRSAAAAPAQDAGGKSKVRHAKKDKVVRDSFTMPKADYERIALLKRKCLDAGVAVKKSELLRAGLQLLESASSKRLLAAISALDAVKTGRPAQSE